MKHSYYQDVLVQHRYIDRFSAQCCINILQWHILNLHWHVSENICGGEEAVSSVSYLWHGKDWENDQRFTRVLGSYQLFCMSKPRDRSGVCLQWGLTCKICSIDHPLFYPSIKKQLMKPKIFTPICRERLVNLLFRNFYIGILLLPRAGWWSWAPPAHKQSGNSVPKQAAGRAFCPWCLCNTAHKAAVQKLSEMTSKMVSRVKYGT